MKNQKVIVHEGTSGERDTAVSYYRAKLPFSFCRRQLAEEGIDLQLLPEVYGTDYDAVILQRVVKAPYLEYLEHILGAGIRVGWTSDDDYWHIPDHNPAAQAWVAGKESLAWLLPLVTAKATSTPTLAGVVREQGFGEAIVCPNLVDLTIYSPIKRDHDKVRILWCGSNSHVHDIELLVEAVERLCLERDDVVFLFYGDIPEPMCEFIRIQGTNLGAMVPHPRFKGKLGVINGTGLGEYFDTLAHLQPDISLCPLEENQFNRSKSAIKYFETALNGAAVIATDIEPYRVIRNGETGLLIGNNHWYDAILSLIENASYRHTLNANAVEQITQEHSWQHASHESWLQFFRAVGKETNG